MSSTQEIDLIINKDGSIEYTIKGIKGNSCEDVSKIFESIGKIDQSEKTSEYYEKESEAQTFTRRK